MRAFALLLAVGSATVGAASCGDDRPKKAGADDCYEDIDCGAGRRCVTRHCEPLSGTVPVDSGAGADGG